MASAFIELNLDALGLHALPELLEGWSPFGGPLQLRLQGGVFVWRHRRQRGRFLRGSLGPDFPVLDLFMSTILLNFNSLPCLLTDGLGTAPLRKPVHSCRTTLKCLSNPFHRLTKVFPKLHHSLSRPLPEVLDRLGAALLHRDGRSASHPPEALRLVLEGLPGPLARSRDNLEAGLHALDGTSSREVVGGLLPMLLRPPSLLLKTALNRLGLTFHGAGEFQVRPLQCSQVCLSPWLTLGLKFGVHQADLGLVPALCQVHTPGVKIRLGPGLNSLCGTEILSKFLPVFRGGPFHPIPDDFEGG
jgi:hypothetical protein